MKANFKFSDLLPKDKTQQARKLAMIARQTKIEKFLLAEIMFNGNTTIPRLDFILEKERIDLVVCPRKKGKPAGVLVEAVEAKMCHTDCLARELTGHKPGSRHEYRDELKKDKAKLINKFKNHKSPVLTLILFVLHQQKFERGDKYYGGES